jgi:large subunit ribosomal protein L20
MPRVTNAPASRRRRKRMLEQAKGYFGNKSKLYRYATEAVSHALLYAYRDRRAKKRTWRSLWITRLNIACRENGITYSRFMEGITAAGIKLDRKVMSDIAAQDAAGFKTLIDQARAALQEKVSSPRAPDDLTRIEGITAPINELLVREKITSFARLGVTSVTRLNTILAEGGGRFRNIDPKTWPKQALVAANSGSRV